MVYGLERSEYLKKHAVFSGDFPSNIAKSLISGDLDIGLVPVSIIPELKESHIISDFCIGCDGKVASVGLFSETPVEELEAVYLDYQSRSSVALAKILLKEYWKVSPRIIEAPADFINKIEGKTGAVIIGDRALKQLKISKYYYDMGLAWKEYTGLPFLFAAWVSTIQPTQEFIEEFNKANASGFDNLDEIVSRENFPSYPLKEYYQQNISYQLDAKKLEAMKLFHEKIKAIN